MLHPCSFTVAATRLAKRYYRRYPKAPQFKWDQTSIKDRWYRRQTCQYVCVRLGGKK